MNPSTVSASSPQAGSGPWACRMGNGQASPGPRRMACPERRAECSEAGVEWLRTSDGDPKKLRQLPRRIIVCTRENPPHLHRPLWPAKQARRAEASIPPPVQLAPLASIPFRGGIHSRTREVWGGSQSLDRLREWSASRSPRMRASFLRRDQRLSWASRRRAPVNVG